MAQISDDNSDLNSNDDLSTSSADSSDDDSIIDVGSNEMDFAYAFSPKKSSIKTAAIPRKLFKNEKNKKRHHNASEKVRRIQLKSCFIALKNAIDSPDKSNNETLKAMARAIDERLAESKRLDEEIKKIQREILEQEKLIKKGRSRKLE